MDEHAKIKKAAKQHRRSLSSFVAEAAIARAERVIGGK
jgi:uncharacterized protein (DUF1778 family)